MKSCAISLQSIQNKVSPRWRAARLSCVLHNHAGVFWANAAPFKPVNRTYLWQEHQQGRVTWRRLLKHPNLLHSTSSNPFWDVRSPTVLQGWIQHYCKAFEVCRMAGCVAGASLKRSKKKYVIIMRDGDRQKLNALSYDFLMAHRWQCACLHPPGHNLCLSRRFSRPLGTGFFQLMCFAPASSSAIWTPIGRPFTWKTFPAVYGY